MIIESGDGSNPMGRSFSKLADSENTVESSVTDNLEFPILTDRIFFVVLISDSAAPWYHGELPGPKFHVVPLAAHSDATRGDLTDPHISHKDCSAPLSWDPGSLNMMEGQPLTAANRRRANRND